MPLLAAADQHFDSPVALPARGGGFVAQEPLLAEGASLDLVARNASLNQRVTNGVDTTFAQGLVVLVGAARIRVTADADLDGGIRLDVSSDVSRSCSSHWPECPLVRVEQDILERNRARQRTRLALGTYRMSHG